MARPFSVVRSVAILAATLSAASCAAFSPRTRIEAPARALGIDASSDRCRRSAGELVASVVDRGPGSVRLPDDVRQGFACLSLRDNLARDEMRRCSPLPEDVYATRLPARRRVVGDLAYVGVDPREYAYDLVPEPDGLLGVEVRIAFVGDLVFDRREIASMQQKLDVAASLWTAGAPAGAMRFRFRAVTRADNPHYVIDLVDGEPRTPFDLTWGNRWSAHLVAHEVGHMMGLDDEYEQLRKTLGHALGREAAWRADPTLRLEWLKCDLQSLMCDSKGEEAKPLPHHYYVIARRRFCRTGTAGFNAVF